MRRCGILLMGLSLLGAGCRGTAPELYGRPEEGISSMVIAGRMVLASGETRSGRFLVNLESEGGREAQVYRLAVAPGQTLLYQIEPGSYHLAPTRSLFGFHHTNLKVTIEGRSYTIPFPRDILRKPAVAVKPTKIVPLGILEASLSPALPGRQPVLKVSLDDSIEARRRIVEDLIHRMMDPSAPSKLRESAIAWTRALDQTLNELLSEIPRSPLYKPAP